MTSGILVSLIILNGKFCAFFCPTASFGWMSINSMAFDLMELLPCYIILMVLDMDSLEITMSTLDSILTQNPLIIFNWQTTRSIPFMRIQ